ncbi:MAG: FAD-binding protein, partial [Treponema sp.]|nr:FAD-binding protein [Treponema sp.]
MIKDISIMVQPQDEKNESEIKKQIVYQLKKDNISFKDNELTYIFQKKSIDARHGQIKLYLKYKVFIGEKPGSAKNVPEWKNVSGDKKIIIIGAGPAGLFAALRFLKKSIKPIIIERGEQTSDRKKSIAKISTEDNVDPNSNYCFGEGGAGTFSDGKLYTRSNKRGNIDSILNIFAHFGADEKILTDA